MDQNIFFKISLSLIEAFARISGLRLNERKTEALWIGSKMNSDKKFCVEEALCIWFATDQDMAISLTYNEKLAKIRSILGCWRF